MDGTGSVNGFRPTRTKSASILWNSYKKFAEITRTGMADYVIIMQKVEREEEWIHVTHDNTDEEFHHWTELASPSWMNISRTNVLNAKLAKEEKDEKHMTPLQLDLIRELIHWYTNENEIVFDPFGGIFSVGYEALKANRKAIMSELKESYFDTGVSNLEEIENDSQMTIFDIEGENN